MSYSFASYLPYYRRNLRLAFPVMLTQLGAALVGLFDSIMVGHYGTTDLAAVSFSNALFFTVMVFAMGALMAITPIVGYAVGAEEGKERMAELLANGLVFMLLVVLFVFVLLVPCIPLLNRFGQDPEVVATAGPYYILIVLSILPFLFFCLCKQFLEGLGNTTVAMVITVVCNLLNILLNWVFIFGHWGFPAMGATGAGWATLIARTLTALCFVFVMLGRRDWRQYITLISRRMFRWNEVKQYIRIGTPIGLQSFVEAFLFTASFVIIGWISKESLAAHHIANQMADLTFMLALGIGSATTIRVSHQLGRGDLQAVRMASRASIHLCLLMNTIGAGLMIFLRNYLPYIFTDDPEVIPIASTLILIAGLFQYADGLQCVGAAMLRGIRDVRVPMRIAFFAYIGVALPLGLFLTFPLGLGAKGMWIAFILGLAIPAVCYHVRFNRQLVRLQKQAEKKSITVVAAVIFDKEGRIFATQRGYGEWKDWWEFPGGKIEAGESPEMALRREIREELDAEIRVGELLRTIDYDYPKFHLTMHCFRCEPCGTFTLKEHEAARWLRPSELRSVRWLPADEEIIAALERGGTMETERILLRPWQESDAEALFKYAGDPEVGPRAGWPPHQSVEESLEIIRTIFHNDHTWAIELKETGEPIGCIGYFTCSESNIHIGENDVEAGYWVARPYWNKGICTESLRLLLDYCFRVKGYQTVWSDFFVDNPASGRVMEKCGFRDTGEINYCSRLMLGSDRPVKIMKLTRVNYEVG